MLQHHNVNTYNNILLTIVSSTTYEVSEECGFDKKNTCLLFQNTGCGQIKSILKSACFVT